MTNISAVKNYLLELQKTICKKLEEEDATKKFEKDNWKNGENSGSTCILENGHVIEKAGVNFSHVFGKKLPSSITQQQSELKDFNYQAMGISVIVHPRNPYVPTAHMNVRFFIAEKKDAAPVWWFGGGFDLTPYYGFEEDCIHWHKMAKEACDPFGAEIYPLFKKQCDDYFFLPHRKEPRGIGGLFFDHFNQNGFDHCFALTRSIADHFLLAYLPILTRRKRMIYGQHQRDFQRYRRGRYVEFNLLFDRGTLFGLQSGGRTESILISLPPEVIWRYHWQPDMDSPEDDLLKKFLIIKEWV